MVAFNKFFTSVFLAIVYASSAALALTVPINSKHATHAIRTIANDAKIEVYHPASTYEVSCDSC
jgi:extracellular elastinolytic metalloproteinase